MGKKLFVAIPLVVFSCCKDNTTPYSPEIFSVSRVEMNGVEGTTSFNNVAFSMSCKIKLTAPIDPLTLSNSIMLATRAGQSVGIEVSTERFDSVISIASTLPLNSIATYNLFLMTTLKSKRGTALESDYIIKFVTQLDSSFKHPVIGDSDLLTLVQRQTFRYFWDYAHPVSGLARERNGSGETVTSGGSGFGLMAIPIGIERNFITRSEGVERINKIVDFLTTADRFHGAWSHWLNGSTGKVIPFSTNDNGGDLVETSYMAAGLLCVRQYLDTTNSSEKQIVDKINTLLSGIEWSWYTKNNEDVLYWHWSPTVGWAMNMQVRGYNEALITYFMAATSTTYPINASVYHKGWANNGGIANGKSFYGIKLPVGYDYGGPLFFAHYSFLGLNPTNLSDQYANYWEQNVSHTLINRLHCINNPGRFLLYSAQCWGLTASDDNTGYGVHEPTRDIGVISPTAALSSFPYTPEYSMEALKFFYYVLGDRIWGEYGFYDAFNPTVGWWGNSYLAIDQGPIIVMIENHRSGLCWNLFMSAPEVQAAITKLGFQNTPN